MQVLVLGYNLGTCSEWEGDPGEAIIFLDFQPAPELETTWPLTAKSLLINQTSGDVEAWDEKTKVAGWPWHVFIHPIHSTL